MEREISGGATEDNYKMVFPSLNGLLGNIEAMVILGDTLEYHGHCSNFDFVGS